MKPCINYKSSHMMKSFLFITLCILNGIKCETVDLTNISKNGSYSRRCLHKRSNHQKHFLGTLDKRIVDSNPSEVEYEKLRIHFDYAFTLNYEEKILRDLVIPPVKKLLESTLKIKRFPGKIRFPKHLDDCEGIPIPSYLKNEGVDADLIIVLSTNRGLNKYKYESNKGDKSSGDSINKRFNKKNSSTKDYFNHKIKINPKVKSYRNITYYTKTETNANLSHNRTKEGKNSQKLPWEINDGDHGVAGWSFMCAQDIYTLRPIAGIMQYVEDLELNAKSIEEAIWTTLHEITHILVMDFELFSDFIDENFIKLGYEKTIKIKTRLKYLDKILEERHHLMNDYLEFGRFGKNKTFFNLNEMTRNKSEFNLENEKEEMEGNQEMELMDESEYKELLEKIKFNNSKTSPTENLQNKEADVKENILHKIKDNIKISTIMKRISMLSATNSNSTNQNLDKKLVNYFTKKHTKTFTKNSSSTNITKLKEQNEVKTFGDHDLNKNNLSVYENFDTGTYFEPKIELPVLSEFYEIKIYPELNITTLATYIDNFLENTKMFIITPNVLEAAKKHYGCNKIFGVELENFGGLGTAYSHWSKRILNTDYLIADSYGEYYVSNITLALFEDSGWYKVDFSKSDKILWGKNKGCAFLSEGCVFKEEIENPLYALKNLRSPSIRSNLVSYDTNFKDEFCLSMDDELCSISNIFRATCGLKQIDRMKAQISHKYLEDQKIFSINGFGDFCPYPEEWLDEKGNSIGSCKYGDHIRKELGEKVCENCRCFRSSLTEDISSKIKKPVESKTVLNRKNEIRASCYETRCRENNNGKIELLVYVEGNEIICPRGGGLVSVEGYFGYIKCPKTEIICDGMMDPKASFSKSSSYKLTADLSQKLMNFYDENFEISFNK